ncbi:MAG: ATP-binding protein [Ignavibacteriales bacterium CG_4_9_14_3_um_filter_34_10]|nr:MAG: ATP-binding protein [Ignavibacteriales bacterium CG_4_9_14_3_um_filter_34_10]
MKESKLDKKIFTKVIPSDANYLPDVEEFVMQIAKEANVDPTKLNSLALSVAEASSNSIIHGNKRDITKNVLIEIEFDDKYFSISLTDEGKGFDISKVPDPTEPENILKESGRGIHIMKSFLDDLKYEFSEKGTKVTLTIKLNLKQK